MSSILQDRDAVTDAVRNASSMRECLNSLGLRAAGGNYKALHAACNRFELEVPLVDPKERTKNARAKKTIPLNEILIENSTYTNRSQLKKSLVKDNLLEWKCYGENCTVTSEWNNKPLMLQLEHKNGVWNDNRIENLEFLCPNCHSQTDTFCARNKVMTKTAKVTKSRPTKIIWPSNEELNRLVKEGSYTSVAKTLGVSDNAVRKRLKR